MKSSKCCDVLVSLIFLLKYLKLPSIILTAINTDLCHSVIAIQKIDISLHAVTAILYKVFQGDGGCAK